MDALDRQAGTTGWVMHLCFIACGWLLGLAWFAISVAIGARSSGLGIHVWALALLVWLFCIVLVSIGTYRIVRKAFAGILCIAATALAVLLQCVLFGVLMIPIGIEVHFRAGGRL